MNIPKAIEVLQEILHGDVPTSITDRRGAMKLGREALKRIQSQYDPDHQIMRIPLPGETEE